ncbi:hypothetical protein ACFOEZ_04335 [Tianweitania populi]|uniref:Membrane protein n=1 Tax=Tianweitania populi TaxID=1607949 RepID=A0A8J3GJ66_9HYPH|nr:hypothetical protein [Tianweitania populi]GHD07893.1 membrane protein [Tianweitania populi]
MTKKPLYACLLMTALAGCASAPGNINNACAVFNQRDGFFDDWHAAAKRTERAYGIPVPILMATLRRESGFQSDARPPRTKLLGLIPWSRPSSAYGYSQALDGTWRQYRLETGRSLARRNSFADAVDFVGWYHARTVATKGVAPNDAYNLYLAYYLGWSGFDGGATRDNKGVQRYAREMAAMAKRYEVQLASCRGL